MPRMNKVGTTATRVITSGQYGIEVRYHDTRVIFWDRQSTVTLDTGGYNTVTTRTRINQACNQWGLPLSVSTKLGQLTIHNRKAGTRQLWDGRVIEVAL